MNILDKIVERKKELVAEARMKIPQSLLEKRCRSRLDHRPFFKRLETPGPGGANIIAEIKRASPSKGPIRPDLNATDYARFYEKGGRLPVRIDGQGLFHGNRRGPDTGSHGNLIAGAEKRLHRFILSAV